MKNNFIKMLLIVVLFATVVLPNSQTTVNAASKYTATVNTEILNVRKTASSKSAKIGQLKKKAKVTVYVKNKKGWATIKYKNKKGYVSASYLSYAKPKAVKTYAATVNTKVLNVRASASSKSKKIAQLKKNAKVTVYVKNKKGWATIKYKNKKRYVSAAYLKYPKKYVSYKRNKNYVFTIQSYSLFGEGSEKSDITNIKNIHFIKTTAKGDLWSDNTVWKETSKGLKVYAGKDATTLSYELKYPIKKNQSYQSKNKGYVEYNTVKSVNKTIKLGNKTWKNVVHVEIDPKDNQYMYDFYVKPGFGVINRENNRSYHTEVISYKKK